MLRGSTRAGFGARGLSLRQRKKKRLRYYLLIFDSFSSQRFSTRMQDLNLFIVFIVFFLRIQTQNSQHERLPRLHCPMSIKRTGNVDFTVTTCGKYAKNMSRSLFFSMHKIIDNNKKKKKKLTIEKVKYSSPQSQRLEMHANHAINPNVIVLTKAATGGRRRCLEPVRNWQFRMRSEVSPPPSPPPRTHTQRIRRQIRTHTHTRARTLCTQAHTYTYSCSAKRALRN